MKIFIAAGEPSGDLYGSILANALRRLSPGVTIAGIGGKLMAEAGVELIASIDDLAIFGFYEGIKAYPRVRKFLKTIVSCLDKKPPDILLPIAFSNFNLMLLKNYLPIRPFNPLVIYFAPPQLWAWGKWRARLLKKYTDAVICLFPFEESFFKNLGINAVYLGNPLLDHVKSRQSKSAFRKTWSLNPDSCILSFMPGSRADEVRLHLPLMLDIFSKLKENVSNLSGFVILSEHINFSDLPAGEQLFYVREKKYDIMKNSDLVLLTSGTAALEAMLLETPAVSIYTLSPLSYAIARRTVKLDNFSLPNLIAGREIQPEFIQPDFHTLHPVMSDLLKSHQKLETIKRELAQTKKLLGPPGAAERIARFLLMFYKIKREPSYRSLSLINKN